MTVDSAVKAALFFSWGTFKSVETGGMALRNIDVY